MFERLIIYFVIVLLKLLRMDDNKWKKKVIVNDMVNSFLKSNCYIINSK